MSECELKKKLWQEFGNNLLDSGELDEKETDARFNKVLDEAKKEFPKYHRINDPDFEYLHKGEKAYLWDDREFNNENVTKWFEKWFGKV